MSLSGNGLGKKGLSCSGRAHKQSPLRKLCAYLYIFAGIVQKVHHLLEGLLGLLLSRNVLKGNPGLLLNIDLGI